MTTGEILKDELGLSKYSEIKVIKFIKFPFHLYMIFYYSRNINYPITRALINRCLSTNYVSMFRGWDLSKPRYYPPVDLVNFDEEINNGKYFIVCDLAGIFLKNYRENVNKDIKFYKYKDNRLEESLYFADLIKGQAISDLTKQYKNETNELMGKDNVRIKLIECEITEDKKVIFKFLSEATEKYPKNHKFTYSDNKDNFNLKRNSSKLYTLEIGLIDFFDWLDTYSDKKVITTKDVKEIFNYSKIQLYSDVPSFHWQGTNYRLSQIDGSLYPTDIPDTRWKKRHGEYNFLDKHLAGVINQISFWYSPMASMLNKKLKEYNYI